ncbi:GLPGLI family protein [Tenacibaculum haliotis]|uniref:GLPGLI family protein n=1 Tax=Tenacibaculum haliotis TaxID=1888914 RepID=UPI0021AFEA0D|nr:GLPGLI family protein [Tenacibaculum haliotis]MCT4700046.1 GLPGLI family protein [Tenacibaculum haliotis]
MKEYTLIFLLFITISIYAQKDSGIVLYKVLSRKEVRVSKIIGKNNSKNLRSFFKKPAEFELSFKGDKSLYKRKVKFNKDGEREKVNFFEIVGGSDGVFYCEKGKVIESTNEYDESFLIEYDSDVWKITQESKQIGKYICYKAISKNNRIVWFTPEIPLQFGPKQLKGLPGLILEVEIGKISIIASEITFKPIDSIKQNFKGTVISESDYRKKISEMAKSIGF